MSGLSRNKNSCLLMVIAVFVVLLSMTGLVHAQATFQAQGTAVSWTGTGNTAVAWPAHQAGDIALLFVESTGGQAATLAVANGFTAVTNSPQSTGAGTAGTRLSVFWARATSASMASPSVTIATGDHGYAVILTYRNVIASGNPWVTIAASDLAVAGRFAALFNNATFRIYTHNDIVGVQVGGAVKNVMAIAAGIADGLGFGANTRAALITRGLAEIMRLGIAMGGRPETFMGLSGLGDLVLTCTDNQSRNRQFGLALAKGKSPEQIRSEIGQAVEGVGTAATVARLAQRYNVEMPICAQVQRVIEGKISPRDAVQELLTRKPGTEW